jgi:hypothetical protein
MPGFEEELARLDAATFLPLPPGAAASAAVAAGDALARGSGGVKLYRQLRWPGRARLEQVESTGHDVLCERSNEVQAGWQ